MAWRLAKSLDVLRAQVNALSPNRSKISDGTIGNAEHSARTSDHNPDTDGVVKGMDLTNDPDHGIRSRSLAEALITSRDPRIKYVISDGQIASGAAGPQPWVWRPYTGKNSHHHHVHISVRREAKFFDSKEPWSLSDVKVAPAEAKKPVEAPKNPVLALGNKGLDVRRLQTLLNAKGAKLTVDDDYGDKTKKAVEAFQRKAGLVADGRVGPSTWEALAG